jgi:hypothetical protein
MFKSVIPPMEWSGRQYTASEAKKRDAIFAFLFLMPGGFDGLINATGIGRARGNVKRGLT